MGKQRTRQGQTIPLFFELTPEEQAKRLARQKNKVSFSQEREDKERNRRAHLRLNGLKPKENLEEFYRELAGEGGIDIGDGWYRIFTLNKYGLLQVNVTTRLEEKELEVLSKEAKDIKSMAIWPKGTLAKSNPWRSPHFSRVVIAKPVWHEEIQQYSISFDGDIYIEPPMSDLRRKRLLKRRMERKLEDGGKQWSTLTFFFGKEIVQDTHMEGYWTPRQQKASQPWVRGDRVVRAPKIRVPQYVVPDSQDLMVLGADEGVPAKKARLIRRYLSERPDLVQQDIKAMVEFWLKASGLGDPFPK